jgi:ribonuclease J
MVARPSMWEDIRSAGLKNGLFIYSLWNGYRDNYYQNEFEYLLNKIGFSIYAMHTGGHATMSDINKVLQELKPRRIIPIHTMAPELFINLADQILLKKDGETFYI